MEEMMTIIYNKRLGIIKGIFSGEQHLDTLYGDESQDYLLIWDELVIPYDEDVVRVPMQYKVNAETKSLEMVLINKYPVAR